MTPTFWDHVLAVALGVVLPVLGALQHRHARGDELDEPMTGGEKVAFYWFNALLIAGVTLVTLLVWYRGDRTLAGIGLGAPKGDLDAALVLAAVFLVTYAIDTWRQLATPERLAETRARWRRETPFMPSTGREVRHSIALVVAASVGEEILYRGFLVLYLVGLLGASAAAVIAAVALPAFVFAVCHLYQNIRAVLKIFLLSCVFGAILVLTGSVWIGVALHFVVDFVATALGPRLLAVPTAEAGP